MAVARLAHGVTDLCLSVVTYQTDRDKGDEYRSVPMVCVCLRIAMVPILLFLVGGLQVLLVVRIKRNVLEHHCCFFLVSEREDRFLAKVSIVPGNTSITLYYMLLHHIPLYYYTIIILYLIMLIGL